MKPKENAQALEAILSFRVGESIFFYWAPQHPTRKCLAGFKRQFETGEEGETDIFLTNLLAGLDERTPANASRQDILQRELLKVASIAGLTNTRSGSLFPLAKHIVTLILPSSGTTTGICIRTGSRKKKLASIDKISAVPKGNGKKGSRIATASKYVVYHGNRDAIPIFDGRIVRMLFILQLLYWPRTGSASPLTGKGLQWSPSMQEYVGVVETFRRVFVWKGPLGAIDKGLWYWSRALSIGSREANKLRAKGVPSYEIGSARGQPVGADHFGLRVQRTLRNGKKRSVSDIREERWFDPG